MRYNGDNLEEVLHKHELWLNDEIKGGSRADFSYSCLSGKDLSNLDLSWANFNHANLYTADLHCANLTNASFLYANLNTTNLTYSEMCHSNLRDANLYSANLTNANLAGANLRRANLDNANLENCILANVHDIATANLQDINLDCAKPMPYIPMTCPDKGSFIGYKKAGCCIVTLEIPADARRTSSTGRKCRCDKARVLDIIGIDSGLHYSATESDFDPNFIYKVGEIVQEPKFCTNRFKECAEGIHFFMNEQEAIYY